MPRHDRAHGVHSSKRERGPAHGLGEMKRRRESRGMSRDDFARLLRQLGIKARP